MKILWTHFQSSLIARLIVRFLMTMLPCFVSYKVFVAVISDLIPGQPFYGYRWTDWLIWSFNWRECLFITIVSVLFFCIGYVIFKRLSNYQLICWGGLLGIYVALYSYDFIVPAFEHAMDLIIPFGRNKLMDTFLGVLGLILLLIVPLALAWLIGALGCRFKKGGNEGISP